MIKKKMCAFIVIGIMVGVIFIGLTPEVDAVRGSATVKGYVRDQNNTGIPNANVWAHTYDWGTGTNTGSNGYYEMSIEAGHFWVGAKADGFLQNETEIDIADGETKWVNLTLSPRPPELCILKGYVKNSTTGIGLGSVHVSVNNDELGYNNGTDTYPNGYFEMKTINGMLKVDCGKENYKSACVYVEMFDNQTTWQNISLEYRPENSVVKGFVKEFKTNASVPNAWINIDNRRDWWGGEEAGGTGYYEINTIAGRLWVSVNADGYYSNETNFEIAEYETEWLNITMYPMLEENAKIKGFVNETGGNNIWAKVEVYGYGSWEKETETYDNGYYERDIIPANLTLFVTSYHHASNKTLFSVSAWETLWLNVSLDQDDTPPEITDIMLTLNGNVSVNNPTTINATVTEQYPDNLRECSIYLGEYKSEAHGEKDYILTTWYRYNAEGDIGSQEKQLGLVQINDFTYNIGATWDATAEGGWIGNTTSKEYVASGWHSWDGYRIDGQYYNSTNPTPIWGQALFSNGKLQIIDVSGMKLYPKDDPTGMFAPRQNIVSVDTINGEITGREDAYNYYSVINLTFNCNSMVPGNEYAVIIFANDYGENQGYNKGNILYIDVDNTPPKVESINLNPAPPVNGYNVTFTIIFTEEMNQSTELNVTFGLTAPYDAYTVSGSWYNSTVWNGSFTTSEKIADGIYNISISNGIDFAKNTMIPDTNHTFSVDTTEPVFEGVKSAVDPQTGGTIILSWDAASDLTSVVYNIYMALTPGGEDFSTANYTTTNLSYTITGLENGQTYYFVVRAEDEAENEEMNVVEVNATPTLETAKPVSQVAALSKYKTMSTFDISYTSGDGTGSGVKSVELWYSRDHGDYIRYYTDEHADGLITFTASEDGFYEFYTIAIDKATNAEDTPTTADANTTVDTAKPSSYIEKTLPYWQNTLSFTISMNAADYTSNVKNVTLWYQYSSDNSSWNNRTVYNVDPESPWSILFTGNNGHYMFYSVAADFAGNKEDASETPDLIIGVDTEKPTADAGNDQTVNQHTEVTFNGSGSSDTLSGINSYVWTFTDEKLQTLSGEQPQYTFNNAGEFLITLNATDRAGNWDTDTVTVTVKDATQPTIIDYTSISEMDENTITEVYVNVSDNYDSSVALNVILVLGTESVEMNYVSGNTFNVTIGPFEPGSMECYFNVSDSAGNWRTTTISTIIVKDVTKPCIISWTQIAEMDEDTTAEVYVNTLDNYDSSAALNVILVLGTESVEMSHVSDNTFKAVLGPFQPGSISYKIKVQDSAGNLNTTSSQTVIINDVTPPVITPPSALSATLGKSIRIDVEIKDNVEITSVVLYYRSVGEIEYKPLSMEKSGNNTYSVVVPGEDVTDSIEYYLVVTDASGNIATLPATNPDTHPYKIPVSVAKENGYMGLILAVTGIVIFAVILSSGFVYYKKKPKEKKPPEVVDAKPKIEPRKVKYNRGSCYIIREQTPETSFKVFADFVKKGAPGLCITRTNPEDIKEKYKLKNVEVLWLTTGREDEHSINPTHVEKMTWTIKEFIKNNRNSAVLLDGVEYLIVQNNFLTILKSLQALEDTVSINKSILIIPISPIAISEKEMSYLERDFVVV